MKKIKTFKGSVTVEASLALPIFLLGFVLILSLVRIIRVESMIQHSVNRMAIELSEYCYAADKLSLTDAIVKSNMTVGEAVENIAGMTGLMSDETSEDSEGMAVITELTDFLLGDTADMAISGPIVEGICHMLMPKYIAENKTKADKYLEELSGITISDIDFRYSTLLKDGKSVKLTAIYNLKLNTFGFFEDDMKFTMQNNASTAAWLGNMTKKETEEEESEAEEEEENEPTKWKLLNFERGKAWVAQIKSENADKATAAGKGIHLYDEKEGVFTTIRTVNVFSQTYSSYDSSLSGAAAFKLNEKEFRGVLRGYAKEVLKDTSNVGGDIKMEDGTVKTILTKNRKSALIVVIPEEAKENEELYNSILEIGKSISDEHKVKIDFVFSEKAL
ncbi:MAG: pilus assembly protein [Oscillospiraceae bacterium]|nr:pilus assembly protein [Oscillospiraceae bacterium]